jgi:hypothetical protein
MKELRQDNEPGERPYKAEMVNNLTKGQNAVLKVLKRIRAATAHQAVLAHHAAGLAVNKNGLAKNRQTKLLIWRAALDSAA